MSNGKYKYECATDMTVAVIQRLDLPSCGLNEEANRKNLNQLIQEVYKTAIDAIEAED